MPKASNASASTWKPQSQPEDQCHQAQPKPTTTLKFETEDSNCRCPSAVSWKRLFRTQRLGTALHRGHDAVASPRRVRAPTIKPMHLLPYEISETPQPSAAARALAPRRSLSSSSSEVGFLSFCFDQPQHDAGERRKPHRSFFNNSRDPARSRTSADFLLAHQPTPRHLHGFDCPVAQR